MSLTHTQMKMNNFGKIIVKSKGFISCLPLIQFSFTRCFFVWIFFVLMSPKFRHESLILISGSWVIGYCLPLFIASLKNLCFPGFYYFFFLFHFKFLLNFYLVWFYLFFLGGRGLNEENIFSQFFKFAACVDFLLYLPFDLIFCFTAFYTWFILIWKVLFASFKFCWFYIYRTFANLSKQFLTGVYFCIT